MVKPQYLIHVQYASAALENKWAPLLTKAKLKKWVQAVCQSSGEITLRLVNSKEGLDLNRLYRGQDHATNILTFSLNMPSEALTQQFADTQIQADLVFCMPVIEREAKEQKKEVINHFIHLLVHGILHAQGFDHEDATEADAMEALEVAILQRLKLENPYT